MRDPLSQNDADYEAVRGDEALTIENFIRWEQVKLRDACREAVVLLQSAAQPTREYLDYMFTTDVGMREIRGRITKHRERLAELEAIRSGAALKM